MDSLFVNEIFYSIQGESSRQGLPCVFVRLMGCHLRCHYCDTTYAFYEGQRRNLDEILAEVRGHGCDLVEVTGGEPLLQPATPRLVEALCDEGFAVLVETSGACDVGLCDRRAVRVMDLKTPDSGEAERNDWANLERLGPQDEVKFVLCSERDYVWARDVIRAHRLDTRVAAVLLSPVHELESDAEVPGAEGLGLRAVAEWVLEDRLPVRVQTQLHKHIWDPAARGV